VYCMMLLYVYTVIACWHSSGLVGLYMHTCILVFHSAVMHMMHVAQHMMHVAQ
jgi:hypothetical protein